MQIYNRWQSFEFMQGWGKFGQLEWSTPKGFREKYGSQATNIDERAIVMMLGAYYEGVGVLVERGLIDVTLVDDLLWAGLKDFWERMEPSLRETRQRESNQRFYDHM